MYIVTIVFHLNLTKNWHVILKTVVCTSLLGHAVLSYLCSYIRILCMFCAGFFCLTHNFFFQFFVHASNLLLNFMLVGKQKRSGATWKRIFYIYIQCFHVKPLWVIFGPIYKVHKFEWKCFYFEIFCNWMHIIFNLVLPFALIHSNWWWHELVTSDLYRSVTSESQLNTLFN